MFQVDSPEPQKGASTFKNLFLPERELTHAEVVALFRALALHPRTTRYAINATGAGEYGSTTLSTSSDAGQLARMYLADTYDDVNEWATSAAAHPGYKLGGAFHFDGKWSWIEYEEGTFSVLHRRDWADVPTILSEAEETATGEASA